MLRTNDRGMERVWWMKVNTVPGRGYPRDWETMGGGWDASGQLVRGVRPAAQDYGGIGELPYEEVFYGGKGTSVHLAPKVVPSWGPNWEEDTGAGEYPNSYFFYVPRLCNHCWNPSCAAACEKGAITKDDQGIVTIDQSACSDCVEPACVEACPYKEITYDEVRRVAWKCDLCAARLADGIAPACIRQCPGRAIWIGRLDEEDGPVAQLVGRWKVALPLHAEWGTGPHVYYIPPLAPAAFGSGGEVDPARSRIPLDELRRLFGAGVDGALETLHRERAQRRTGSSELMDLLIAPRWQTLLGPWPKDPSEVRPEA